MRITPPRVSTAVALAITLAAACQRDPQTAAREFAARAERYVAAGKIEAAILEYRNAIARTPSAADVHYRLALAYEKLGDSANAMREFQEVTQLDGRNVDANLRVATMLLTAGRFDDAERLAQRVLDSEPENVRALTLTAGALEGRGQLVSAARRVAEALKVNGRSAAALVARASLERRRGKLDTARRTLHEALEVEPNSVEVLTALGTVEGEAGNLAAAGEALEKALAVTADKKAARRLLVSFYIRSGRADRAEPHLRALAQASMVDRLVLADYYLSRNKADLAAPLLDSLLQDKQLAPEARLRRAALAARRGRLTEVDGELTQALASPRTEVRARLARSQLLLAQGKLDEALTEAQRAAALEPDAAGTNYAVGVIQRARADFRQAEASLRRAAVAAPKAQPIEYELALVALGRGDVARAVQIATDLSTSTPSPATHALLARTLRVRGNVARAHQVLEAAARKWPDAVDLDIERGYAALAANNSVRARQMFERALRRAPASSAGRAGFVLASVAAGEADNARLSLEQWRAAASDDVPLAVLSARLDFTEGKRDHAEKTLLDLVRRVPNNPDAAAALAQLYLVLGNREEALRYYERAATLRLNPVAELTAVGMLKSGFGDTAGAKQAYERTLALDADAGIAANNLAWLLAKEGQVDAALEAARRAEATLRGIPQALDTLGWMHYLAGHMSDAIRYLLAARDKTPTNPIYHYHLGMAYLGGGMVRDAQAALRRSLDISESFEGADEARRSLATLQ